MSETVRGVPNPGPISLEQLIALNDEIAALARAGMPLERGLIEIGRDLPGRLGEVTQTLGQRMSRGESLTEALAAEGNRFPRLYRAIVEAGARAGRLPAALEGLANYARNYADSRRAVGAAIWYPMIVVGLASLLFAFMTTTVIPRFINLFQDFGIPIRAPLRFLSKAGDAAAYWLPAVPIFFVLIGIAWLWSGRAESLAPGRAGILLRVLPWTRSMLVHFEAANFADLLALLLKQGVPFPEAVVLSAEASGDRTLVHDGRVLAEGVSHGQGTRDVLAGRSFFPPLLRWLLATGPQQGDLVEALGHMAALYRRRAEFEAEKVRIFLPVLLMCGLGATVTLLYGLTLFIPLTTLLKSLSVG